MTTTVEIENGYVNGDVVVNTVEVETFDPDVHDDLDQWWEDEVFPLTGDGRHGSMDAYYEATVTDSDRDELVGETHDWGF
jgi:hypothetical protein